MTSLRELVQNFQVGTKYDIYGLANALGVRVEENATLPFEVVGQIERVVGDDYLVSLQGSDHENRKRFTLAHELGHYLYHRDLIGDGVDDNKMYRAVNAGKFYNTGIKQRHETEANKFAASILMPSALVQQAHNRYNQELKAIADAFSVSKAAMRIRLRSLGLAAHE